jgi:hypothetical protein
MTPAVALRPNLRLTELGIERRCGRCRQFWPADQEFFSLKKPGQLHSWCRACFAEYAIERRARNRTGKAAGLHVGLTRA